MLIVVDTDILIDAGRSVDEAVNFLQRIQLTDIAAISSITQMELMVGCSQIRTSCESSLKSS